MSDSEATSGTTTRAREKGILEQGLTVPHMQNHDVSASPNIHESLAKKAPISTFNKFRVLEEGDEDSLDIHLEPLQEGELENEKLTHSDSECLSPRKVPKRRYNR